MDLHGTTDVIPCDDDRTTHCSRIVKRIGGGGFSRSFAELSALFFFHVALVTYVSSTRQFPFVSRDNRCPISDESDDPNTANHHRRRPYAAAAFSSLFTVDDFLDRGRTRRIWRTTVIGPAHHNHGSGHA